MSTNQLVPVSGDKYDQREIINTIKETVCKGATDSQLRMFIEVCRATGLNPFLKEVFFVPGVGIMAARDGYLRIANEHPQFDGMETSVERDGNDIPIKATCKVWRKDRAHPITCEAFYNEYKKNTAVWQTYKSAMISKVAEVLALKRSFSINGVVTEEEIGEQQPQGSKEAQQEVLQRKLAAIKEDTGPIANEPVIIPVATPINEERKKGSIPFDGLKQIGEMKRELRKITGTDQLYYDTLKVARVEHANELDTKAGREVWKALAAIRTRLTADASLRKDIEALALSAGPKAFAEVISGAGFTDIDDLISKADGDQITAVIEALRKAADPF